MHGVQQWLGTAFTQLASAWLTSAHIRFTWAALHPASSAVLLMLALTRTSDPAVIQDYFHTY